MWSQFGSGISGRKKLHSTPLHIELQIQKWNLVSISRILQLRVVGAVVGDWLESGLFIEWVFEKVCACGWFLWHTCRRRRRRREWVPCRMQAKHSELTYHMANSQSTPHPCYLTQHNSGQNFLLQTCLKTDGQFWLLQVDHKESAILLVSPRCNNCWHMKSFHNIILVTKWRRSLRIRRRREDLHSWVCGVLKVSASQF